MRSPTPGSLAELEGLTTAELFRTAHAMGLGPNKAASRTQVVTLLATRLPPTAMMVSPAPPDAPLASRALVAVQSWRARATVGAAAQRMAIMGASALKQLSLDDLFTLGLAHGLLLDGIASQQEVVDILLEHFVVYHSHTVDPEAPRALTAEHMYNLGGMCRTVGRADPFEAEMDERYGAAVDDYDISDSESAGSPHFSQTNPARNAWGTPMIQRWDSAPGAPPSASVNIVMSPLQSKPTHRHGGGGMFASAQIPALPALHPELGQPGPAAQTPDGRRLEHDASWRTTEPRGAEATAGKPRVNLRKSVDRTGGLSKVSALCVWGCGRGTPR